MTWLHDHVHFERPALEATLLDYVHEVHHADERIVRLEKVIDQAICDGAGTDPFRDCRSASPPWHAGY